MLLFLSLLLALTLTQGAPIYGINNPDRVPDEYIVEYKQGTEDVVIFAHQTAYTSNIMHTYNISHEYRGFSARLTEEELGKVLDTPFVKSVSCNAHVHLYCTQRQNPTTSWGLARCSNGPLTGPLPYEFHHHPNAGKDVVIYILDTGCNAQHEQFNGRVVAGQNFVTTEPGSDVDQNGHGTHCAGTAAGNTYGIAREARIVCVKVLGRSGGGTWAGVIGGINWCANDKPTHGLPAIASMSLGGGYEPTVNSAVEAAIRSGLPFAIAAGNSRADACNYSPASAEGALTTGSTDMSADDRTDVMSSFSNYGECCHIFAPGSDIPSSYIPNSNSYAVLSGTSMAAPHVAGVAAVRMGLNPSMTPPQLATELRTLSIPNAITGLPQGTPNYLLSNGCYGPSS